ncbi:MAG TPA: hypothetical protein VFX89_08990 [Gammaproteobacteria bacterium]|nr:hypothetical protein [Gammaproteobacteria bacterium]
MAKTKIDAVSFTGTSGRTYDFRIYVWDTRFKSLPGVYVVASRSLEPGDKPRYSPLFVAPADDLSKALKEHARADCFQLHYANVIGVLKEADAHAREQIAADLVGALRPPCNAPDAD